MKDEFDGFIGYGEGISQEENWELFTVFREGISSNEYPDF